MFIHDIYETNKTQKRGIPSARVIPFKIVYATDKIEVDDTVLEKFPHPTAFKDHMQKKLCEVLDMPLATSMTSPPAALTGNASPWPYIKLDGVLAIKKKSVGVEIKTKKTLVKMEMEQSGSSREYICTENEVVPRTAFKQTYQVKGQKDLWAAYNNSPMFNCSDKGVTLQNTYIKKILVDVLDELEPKLREIFDDLTNDNVQATMNIPYNWAFMILVLPTKNLIEWIPQRRTVKPFIDVFGNKSTERAPPNMATLNAKFLSADDSYFVIHGKDRNGIYDDLNLSQESFVKLNLHNEDLFKFGKHDLYWYFGTHYKTTNRDLQSNAIDTDGEVAVNTKIAKKGFYEQLRNMITVDGQGYRILCVQKDQAKINILLDEYCPSVSLKNIIVRSDVKDRSVPLAFESLIGDKSEWKLYIDTVSAFLRGRKISRRRIIAKLTHELRIKLREGKINNLRYAFFEPSLFCLQVVGDGGGTNYLSMTNDEYYAYCVGAIAMRCIQYSSLTDPGNDSMVTRPVYNRTVLRRIVSNVVSSLALHLDTGSDQTMKMCSAILSRISNDVSDQNAKADFSYFFYLGVFSVIAGVDELQGSGRDVVTN